MTDEALAIAQEIRDLYRKFEDTDEIEYHDYVASMARLGIELADELLGGAS